MSFEKNLPFRQISFQKIANAKLSSADGSRTSCLDFLFCKKSPLKLCDTQSSMEEMRRNFVRDKRFAVVSLWLPLMANLSIIDNILLPSYYLDTDNISTLKYQAEIALERLDMASITHKRYHECSDEMIFYTKILRAYFTKREIVIIEPFLQLSDVETFAMIEDRVEFMLQTKITLYAIDYLVNQKRYDKNKEKDA